ncbi:MAG: hypothetical protein ACLFRF_00150 [Desulfobacterales bacterium]
MQVRLSADYAVISGDFIGFSPLSAENRQTLYHLVVDGGARLNQIFGDAMPQPVDVFRGDGWQMLVAEPVSGLRAGLYFRAFIRAHAPVRETDVRMAIGIGPVDYVPAGNISGGDGAAFRRSGKLLESMAAPGAGTLRFAMDGSGTARAIDGMLVLAGALAGRWTPNQARAVMDALAGMTQQQIAAGWNQPISYQAVGMHLKRANWGEIRYAVEVFESLIRGRLKS